MALFSSWWWTVACVLVLAGMGFLVRCFWCLSWKRKGPRRGPKRPPFKTMIVLGSGGHTGEMAVLLEGMDFQTLYSPRIYVLAHSDSHSRQKALTMEERKASDGGSYSFAVIHRSREVGQSFVTSFFTTLRACFHSVAVVLWHRPDLVLCNGPGTCVPVVGAGWLLKVLFVKDVQLVYVESLCRVEDLSLSAKMLCPFLDRLFVQWPGLQQGKAEYHGFMISSSPPPSHEHVVS